MKGGRGGQWKLFCVGESLAGGLGVGGNYDHIYPFVVFKVGLSPSKKNFFVCVTESPLKMIKNAFYFILKAIFVLKMSKFLS